MPSLTIWMLRLLVLKVSPPSTGKPTGTTNDRLFRPKYSYSIFADQLGTKAHSIPAPSSQPALLLLSLKPVIDAPVVTLMMVKSLLPAQPPPALPYNSQGP